MRESDSNLNRSISCDSFDRWLDQGSAPALETGFRAHATACPRCARALAAEREIALALGDFAMAPPPALIERVMERVAGAPQRAPEVIGETGLDWWVRAAAEPSIVLSAALAALLLWRPAEFTGFFAGLARVALSAGVDAMGSLPRIVPPAWLGAPGVVFAVTLAALPVVLWGSMSLYAWLERAFVPRVAAAPVRPH